MDKVILDRLASFNLSMQQKKDLIEVIKYVAKYRVEDNNEEEIKKLIAFLNQYKIQEDGSFPDFDSYIANFDTLNKEFKTYIETHKKELETYVKKENYPAEDIAKLIEFLKKYEIGEDGSFANFEEYISNFDSLNTKFNDYVTSHTEELKQYVKNETIEELKTDINDKFSAINTKFEGIESLISEIQTNISNLKHIPNGGKEGQFIVSDSKGNPIWTDHTCIPSEDNQAYGIEWTKNSNVCTRIGNMELHKTCPIQNRLRGCLHSGKNILHWLNADGWGLAMDNGEIPVLDGSMGDIGVAMPLEYFVKVITFTDKYQIWISDKNIDGTWIRISPCIYSANKTLTRINSAGKEEAFNACIKADDETHVGGNKSETYTDKLHGRPRTGITLEQAIEFCNNRGNGIRVIDYLHYCALQLLFYIEYANFDSQAAVNKEISSGGFKQGGLGVGVTNLNLNKWNNYNGGNPIIPTYFQVENNVGNKSFCDTPFVLGTDYTGDDTTVNTTPAYFHGIHLFGDIWGFIADILIVTEMPDKSRNIVYKLKDGVKIEEVNNTNIKEKCNIIGYQVNSIGYIKEFDLSNGLYFIPKSIENSYIKYDYNYVDNTVETIRIIMTGGAANDTTLAGVGYVISYYDRNNSHNTFGFFTITDLD